MTDPQQDDYIIAIEYHLEKAKHTFIMRRTLSSINALVNQKVTLNDCMKALVPAPNSDQDEDEWDGTHHLLPRRMFRDEENYSTIESVFRVLKEARDRRRWSINYGRFSYSPDGRLVLLEDDGYKMNVIALSPHTFRIINETNHFLSPAQMRKSMYRSTFRLFNREDACITSGITSVDSTLPLSVWPIVLQRAWTITYEINSFREKYESDKWAWKITGENSSFHEKYKSDKRRGPDAIYYLLRNAHALEMHLCCTRNEDRLRGI